MEGAGDEHGVPIHDDACVDTLIDAWFADEAPPAEADNGPDDLDSSSDDSDSDHEGEHDGRRHPDGQPFGVRGVCLPPPPDARYGYYDLGDMFHYKPCAGDLAVEWMRPILFRTDMRARSDKGPVDMYMIRYYCDQWELITEHELRQHTKHFKMADGVSMWTLIRDNPHRFPPIPYVRAPDDRDDPAMRPYDGPPPFNVFSGYWGFYSPDNCDLDAVLDCVRYCWCAGDAEVYEWLLDWMACAAFSSQRMGVTVVIEARWARSHPTKRLRRSDRPSAIPLVNAIKSTFSAFYEVSHRHALMAGGRDIRDIIGEPLTVIPFLLGELDEGSPVADVFNSPTISACITHTSIRYELPNPSNVLAFAPSGARASGRWGVRNVIHLHALPCFVGDGKNEKRLLRDNSYRNLAVFFYERYLSLLNGTASGDAGVLARNIATRAPKTC